MPYCSAADLYADYGEAQVNAWCRLNPDTLEKALVDAGAEIDGYLFSGGYQVPLEGPPANIKKYAAQLAVAKLIVSLGVLKDDPGGEALIEQAKAARRFLEKVAEGKFRIPGYTQEGASTRPQAGNIRVASRPRLDLRGY